MNPNVNKSDNAESVCGFCGKSRGEVARMISGTTAHICDECVAFCIDALASEPAAGDSDTAETSSVSGESHDLRTDAASALFDYAVEQSLSGGDGAALERDVKVLAAAALLHAGQLDLAAAARFAGCSETEFSTALDELAPASHGTIRPSQPPPAPNR